MMKQTLRFMSPAVRLEVYVEIARHESHAGQLDTDLQPVGEPHNRLSISMGSWEKDHNGRWHEATFGQSVSTVREFASREPARLAPLLRLCEIWKEWHLNDLQAGTTLQMAAIGAARDGGKIQDSADYDTACLALKECGLYEDRGYEYGSKWLVKRLPRDITREVVALCDTLSRPVKP